MLNGYLKPAVGMVQPGNPWFGNPSFKIRYAPEEAKKLLCMRRLQRKQAADAARYRFDQRFGPNAAAADERKSPSSRTSPMWA